MAVFGFNKLEKHQLSNFACFWNEQEISRTVVYHFGITFSRRASKDSSLKDCTTVLINYFQPAVQGHVQKYGPHL